MSPSEIAQRSGCAERGCVTIVKYDVERMMHTIQHGPNPETVLEISAYDLHTNERQWTIDRFIEWAQLVHAYEERRPVQVT